jgi:hypothetical protein
MAGTLAASREHAFQKGPQRQTKERTMKDGFLFADCTMRITEAPDLFERSRKRSGARS